MRTVIAMVVFVVGVIVTLAGVLFTLQGVGIVSGSPMSNTTTWSVIGPLIAVLGLVMAVVAWRGRTA